MNFPVCSVKVDAFWRRVGVRVYRLCGDAFFESGALDLRVDTTIVVLFLSAFSIVGLGSP